MSASEWTNWLFLIGGGGIGLLALALLYWSLLHDRARGRRRCRKCWYDMSRSPTLTCSECGWTAKDDKKLHKTRRRWPWAFVALLLGGAAVSCALTPKVRRDGWLSLIPTTFLILYVPSREPGHALASELEDRLPAFGFRKHPDEPGLWDWQWRLLIRRSIATLEQDPGFPRSFPVDQKSTPPGWIFAAVLLQDGYDIGAINALGMFDEVRRALPIAFRPAIRDHWPSETPLHWRIEGDSLFPVLDDTTMTATAVNGVDPPSWISREFVPNTELWVSEDETVAPDGEFEIVFHIDHYVETRTSDDERKLYGSDDISTRIVVGGDIDEIVHPVRSAELDERIKAHTTATFNGTEVKLKMSPELLPTLQTMSLALKIELLADEETIWTTNEVVEPSYVYTDGAWSGFGFLYLKYVDEINSAGFSSIRLTGDQMGALIHSDFDSYWAGEIEIPVDTSGWQQRP